MTNYTHWTYLSLRANTKALIMAAQVQAKCTIQLQKYQFKTGTPVNHMNDTKMYTIKEKATYLVLYITRVFSNDIGMTFGIDKCGKIILNSGQISNE